MTTLLTIRDNIKDFVSKYDKFVMPVIKFIGALLVLISYNNIMGYSSQMKNPVVMFILSLVCAFLPIQLTVVVMGLVGFAHMYAVSLDVGLLYVGIFILMYLLYLRFAPKYGWIIIVMPLLYMLKLHYMIPVVISIFVGPVGIVPMIFGIIFYYFALHVGDLTELLATTTEEGSIQGFAYVLNEMLKDKAMLLTIVVFILVIIVTYIIYRQSFEYAWTIAIGTGAVLGIIFFLVGGIVFEVEVNILIIFFGTVGGAILAVIAQFFKGVLDYSRTEVVQFEDDDYYYYIKAVPKLRISEANVKVKKITGQKVAVQRPDVQKAVAQKTVEQRAATPKSVGQRESKERIQK